MVSSSPKLVCVVRDSLYDRCTCENLVRDKFTRVSGDVRVLVGVKFTQVNVCGS